MEFCIIDCNYFTYAGEVFKQKDGLPMGSPLAPVLSCLVMDKLLEDVRYDIRGKAKVLSKYVDDLLLVIDKQCISEVLSIFNTFHPSINFTHELESHNSIPYLDLRLTRRLNRITFDWFYKPINSGRMLNYVSHHPFHQKMNVAKGLLRRVLLLSDNHHHNKNMVIVEDLLRKNNYPSRLIRKWKLEMINCISNSNNNNNKSRDESASESVTHHVGITYVQGLSESIQKQLNSKNNKVGVAHRNSNSMKGIYNLVKEKVPKMNRSNVVYRINCCGGQNSDCDLCYVGTTGRMLKDRVREHARDLGKKLRHTALVDHALDENHHFDLSNVDILSHEPNYRKRMIKEGCYIACEDTVNYRTDTNNINKLYHNVLSKIKVHNQK